MIDLNPPIPRLSEPEEWWGRLPIVDYGEPLVDVPTDGFCLRSQSLYAEMGIAGASDVVRVRSGVLFRLAKAVERLPESVALVVFDGFRPLAVQKYLYDTYLAELQAAHPDLGDDKLRGMVNQFVAVPNPDLKAPPPHRTGGAVDVYLVDAVSGVPLPMGTEPDATVPESATDWYERHPQEPFTTNRRMLYNAMTPHFTYYSGGFTNYCGEWWHFDYGNQRWANVSGMPNAIYGVPREDLD